MLGCFHFSKYAQIDHSVLLEILKRRLKDVEMDPGRADLAHFDSRISSYEYMLMISSDLRCSSIHLPTCVPFFQVETEDTSVAPAEVDGEFHFEAKQDMPVDGFKL